MTAPDLDAFVFFLVVYASGLGLGWIIGWFAGVAWALEERKRATGGPVDRSTDRPED